MTLPSSIEAHLSEAGFSQTELLILRFCIDGQPVSLREIAAQTKKSTGVLDQAMKKLMRRNIMVRKKVNGAPKYALASMDAVLQWIEEDVQRKTDDLKRRKQDFATFIRTLQQDDAKPKVEYFQGEEGIATAFAQILDSNPKELLHFLPLDSHEDTLCFGKQRAEFNRERRRRNIPLRVIAHDTVYGKRFKDRDALEQRTTKLVNDTRCAIDFEKIISGNTVACFNCAEQTAYFIQYPELAKSESNMFEMVWGNENVTKPSSKPEVQATTKAVQGLRRLFWSKRGAGISLLYALIAAFITAGIQQVHSLFGTQVPVYTASVFIFVFFASLSAHIFFFEKDLLKLIAKVMKTRSAVLVLLASILILLVVTNFFLKQRYEHELQLMREEVRTIARNTADNFTAEELEALQKWTDVDTQAYKSIINRLIEIKKKNPDLMYAYILRKTDSPYFYSFVADAESIDIHSRLDLNDDGLVNDMVAPGYIFLDVYPNKSAIYNAFYLGRASADPEPTYDLWGSWIAGHAPIYDRAGNIKAVIGVDVDASKLPHNNEILSYITILYAFIILIYLGNKALKQRYS